jgi:hypothetical protein
MKRVLLFTDQADQAEPEILALHGRVTHRALGGRLFVARLPDDVETGRLQFSREVTDPVPAALTLSAQEHSVARAFADMLARQATGTMPPGHGLPWDAPGYEAPRQVPLPEEALRAKGLTTETSGYLVGRVAVGLVVVSGPGKLAFSRGEIEAVLSQVFEGTEYLVDANPSGRVSFDIELQTATISASDNKNCSDYEQCEAYWRNPAMKALGYSPDWAGIWTFVDDLRKPKPISWAYAAYFTKYTTWHFAYASIGGPRLVMQYSNGRWGPRNIHRLFAHESGHVFHALDEYKNSECVCGTQSGYFGAPNNNCANCSGKQQVCLMNNNDLRTCFWSRRQFGWGGFTTQTRVTDKNGARTSEAPGVAAWNGRVYAAYRADGSSRISMFNADGTNWSPQSVVTDANGAKTSTGPSLTVLGSRLYMSYRAENSSDIQVSSFDGSNWSSQTNVTAQNSAKTSATPVLCQLNGRLYMFFKGESSGNFYMCSSADGTNWSAQTKITDNNGAKTSAAPAAAVYNGKIWVAFLGDGGANLRAFSFDGTNFSTQTEITSINGAKSSAGPALAVMNGLLYLLYKSSGNKELWACSFDGSTWLGQWKVTDINGALTSKQPALAALPADKLLAIFRGEGSANIWSFEILADAPQPAIRTDRPELLAV